METLYSQIKTIKELPSYIKVNKPEQIKNVFDEWAKKNGLVKEVLEGKTNFLKEYDLIFGEYEEWITIKHGYPIKDKGIYSLEKCIGYSGIQDNKIPAPTFVKGGAITGIPFAIATLGIYAKNYRKKDSRREFLFNSGMGVLGLTVLGAVFGQTIDDQTDKNLEKMKNNAIYLDNVLSSL